MSLKELDLKDKKILYQLDINCRQTNSEIGKKVRLSKQVVDYRIKKLYKDKYITRFATVIDTYKLGLFKHKLYISLENANKETINDMIAYLKNDKKTEWIATCSGKWDIIAGFIVKDIYEFNEALREFDEKYSRYVSLRETTASLGVPHWRKGYILDSEDTFPVVYQGGMMGDYKLDNIDEEIIKLIVNNARMPVVEMAQRLKASTRVVSYRLNNLKKEKIILFHRIFLNLNKINWIFCKAFIKFRNLTKERYSNFFQFCNNQRNLVYLINCVGSWDVELDFEIPDFNSFHKILLEMRDKFADMIKRYDFVIVMNEDKLDYYPGCYPQFD